MSFITLLTDKCDVYHLQSNTQAGEYGVPGETTYSYNTTADLTDVACLFSQTGQGLGASITQAEPAKIVSETYLVHFAIGTDVRLNDKVVFNGNEYKLKTPRTIRNHHIEVEAYRTDAL